MLSEQPQSPCTANAVNHPACCCTQPCCTIQSQSCWTFQLLHSCNRSSCCLASSASALLGSCCCRLLCLGQLDKLSNRDHGLLSTSLWLHLQPAEQNTNTEQMHRVQEWQFQACIMQARQTLSDQLSTNSRACWSAGKVRIQHVSCLMCSLQTA